MWSGTGSPLGDGAHSAGCVCGRPARSGAPRDQGAGALGSRRRAPGHGQQAGDHGGFRSPRPARKGLAPPGGDCGFEDKALFAMCGTCCQSPFRWPMPSPHLTVSIPLVVSSRSHPDLTLLFFDKPCACSEPPPPGCALERPLTRAPDGRAPLTPPRAAPRAGCPRPPARSFLVRNGEVRMLRSFLFVWLLF